MFLSPFFGNRIVSIYITARERGRLHTSPEIIFKSCNRGARVHAFGLNRTISFLNFGFCKLGRSASDQRAAWLIRFAHPRLNRLRKKSKSFVLRRSAPKAGATRLFRYAHVRLKARDSQATRWTLIPSR